ncbi:MAG: J domain-containing protein [Crocinitomicaceae bacterium]|nr:J domain-containing protein [Crocinitomicaceae bacterium]
MAGNRYYDILGLPQNATEKEIRKRYKELAKKFHPDRNPSPDADKMFIAINHAYQQLLTPSSVKSTTFSNAPTEEELRAKQEEIYREKARKFTRNKLKQEHEAQLLFYKKLRNGKLWLAFKGVTFLCFFVVVLMVADVFLPSIKEQELVTGYSKQVFNSSSENEVCLIETKSGKRLFLNQNSNLDFNYIPFFTLETTRIFKHPTRAHKNSYFSSSEIPVHFTFYWAQSVIWILFLVPIVFLFYKKDDVFFAIGHYYTRYVSGSLLIYFLVTENRWLHLLTLGFY